MRKIMNQHVKKILAWMLVFSVLVGTVTVWGNEDALDVSSEVTRQSYDEVILDSEEELPINLDLQEEEAEEFFEEETVVSLLEDEIPIVEENEISPEYEVPLEMEFKEEVLDTVSTAPVLDMALFSTAECLNSYVEATGNLYKIENDMEELQDISNGNIIYAVYVTFKWETEWALNGVSQVFAGDYIEFSIPPALPSRGEILCEITASGTENVTGTIYLDRGTGIGTLIFNEDMDGDISGTVSISFLSPLESDWEKDDFWSFCFGNVIQTVNVFTKHGSEGSARSIVNFGEKIGTEGAARRDIMWNLLLNASSYGDDSASDTAVTSMIDVGHELVPFRGITGYDTIPMPADPSQGRYAIEGSGDTHVVIFEISYEALTDLRLEHYMSTAVRFAGSENAHHPSGWNTEVHEIIRGDINEWLNDPSGYTLQYATLANAPLIDNEIPMTDDGSVSEFTLNFKPENFSTDSQTGRKTYFVVYDTQTKDDFSSHKYSNSVSWELIEEVSFSASVFSSGELETDFSSYMFSILKRDGVTEHSLEGAVFKITNSEGASMTFAPTNDSGFTSVDLNSTFLGVCTLEEIHVPSGYVPMEPLEIELVMEWAGGVNTGLKILNIADKNRNEIVRRGGIGPTAFLQNMPYEHSIEKRDSKTGNLVTDNPAEFEIYKITPGTTARISNEPYAILNTGATGVSESFSLVPGRYELYETTIPNGYKESSQIQVYFDVEGIGNEGKLKVTFDQGSKNVSVSQIDGSILFTALNEPKGGSDPDDETTPGGGGATPDMESIKTSEPPSGSVVRPGYEGVQGSVITYTITTKNTGGTILRDIVIEDMIQEGTTYVENSAVMVKGGIETQAKALFSNGKLKWTVDSLLQGQSVSCSFQVTVDSLPAGVYEATYKNVATVNDEPTNEVTHEGETFVKLPSKLAVSVGDTIDYVMKGIQNSAGKEVQNFIIEDIPAQGLNFTYAQMPAFYKGENIQYTIKYKTSDHPDDWSIGASEIDADTPYYFSLPQLPEGQRYTSIALFFGTVPTDFALDNQIVFTFIVGDDAPNNILINDGWIHYDNETIPSITPENPKVIDEEQEEDSPNPDIVTSFDLNNPDTPAGSMEGNTPEEYFTGDVPLGGLNSKSPQTGDSGFIYYLWAMALCSLLLTVGLCIRKTDRK